MTVYIESEDVNLIPSYAHDGDAGMDIRAAEDIEIVPGETKVVKTGIKLAMPKGIECDVRPRSGLSLKTPLRVANTPGTIDSGYRDVIGVIISNTSPKYDIVEENDEIKLKKNTDKYYIDEKGNKPGTYIIKKGDRIAQLVFFEYITPEFIHRDVKEVEGDRGGGFGHSGLK